MDSSKEAQLAVLSDEYRTYIDVLKRSWLSKNRVNSRDVYEVMSHSDRQRVDDRIREWAGYVTPLAEAWWRERGYRVEWPEDDSEPMKLFAL